jgi:hypothetical protein
MVALTWVVLALLAAHDVSHLLDPGLDTSPGVVALVAGPQWVVLAVVTALILRGDARRSRLLAFTLGAGTAVGFAVIHLLPFAPASFWDLSPSPVSWLLTWVPAAFGVALAVVAAPVARTTVSRASA